MIKDTQVVVLSEGGSIGDVTHSCNIQNRRSRGPEPETKPVVCLLTELLKEEEDEMNLVALAIHHREKERTLLNLSSFSLRVETALPKKGFANFLFLRKKKQNR